MVNALIAIIERSYLFLSQMEKKDLLRSPEWLKTRITVAEVRVIDIVRVLATDTISKQDSRVATVYAQSKSDGISVFISGLEVDWYELAYQLCEILLVKRWNSNDALVFMNILSTR